MSSLFDIIRNCFPVRIHSFWRQCCNWMEHPGRDSYSSNLCPDTRQAGNRTRHTVWRQPSQPGNSNLERFDLFMQLAIDRQIVWKVLSKGESGFNRGLTPNYYCVDNVFNTLHFSQTDVEERHGWRAYDNPQFTAVESSFQSGTLGIDMWIILPVIENFKRFLWYPSNREVYRFQ